MAEILVVDDEDRVRSILKIMLESKGHTVHQAAHGGKAIEVLEKTGMDLVISDIRMDEMDGKELLSRIKNADYACPVVFITAYASMESVIEALRLGAADYLVKPFEEEHVHLAVERALGMGRLMMENRQLKEDLNQRQSTRDAVFVSPEIRKVYSMALKVAAKDTTVLISGDSGTGKEVIAKLIHDTSTRANQKFVAVNCAAFAASLIESELFGHEKGAFTGASHKKEGKFEYADKGTLFLDEVGELPPEAQVKLLRVIQEKCFHRVGGNREIPADVRLLCATNQSLEKQVSAGKFRADLFYRLAVFPLHIPGLKERKADIAPLAKHFIQQHARTDRIANELITPAAVRQLQEYPWPGNIRELSNAVERVMILKDGELPVTSDDLYFMRIRTDGAESVEDLFTLPAAGIDYDEFQKGVVKKALEMTSWNQSAAARLLGLSRARFRTLSSLLENGNGNGKGVADV